MAGLIFCLFVCLLYLYQDPHTDWCYTSRVSIPIDWWCGIHFSSTARRHNKEGGNHLEEESHRQKTMEDIDGGLHPAVDGQSLGGIK